MKITLVVVLTLVAAAAAADVMPGPGPVLGPVPGPGGAMPGYGPTGGRFPPGVGPSDSMPGYGPTGGRFPPGVGPGGSMPGYGHTGGRFPPGVTLGGFGGSRFLPSSCLGGEAYEAERQKCTPAKNSTNATAALRPTPAWWLAMARETQIQKCIMNDMKFEDNSTQPRSINYDNVNTAIDQYGKSDEAKTALHAAVDECKTKSMEVATAPTVLTTAATRPAGAGLFMRPWMPRPRLNFWGCVQQKVRQGTACPQQARPLPGAGRVPAAMTTMATAA